MCGDVEDDTQYDDALFARLLALARKYGAVPDLSRQPADRSPDTGRYMDGLFGDTLTRALDDAATAPAGTRADTVAAQAIVFARLAGFLAGQLPPEADLFRGAMEAFMDGHGEASRPLHDHGHEHHHHGHGHGHDHDHEH